MAQLADKKPRWVVPPTVRCIHLHFPHPCTAERRQWHEFVCLTGD